MDYKYSDDDYCDIYENKICDNCGKCLEMEGVDVRAIKIEDIAKNSDENKILEEEFLEDIKSNLSHEDLEEIKDRNLNLEQIYAKFKEEKNFDDWEFQDAEYEDAFDHIDYDNSEVDDYDLEEATEEIYPGVRKFIRKNK